MLKVQLSYLAKYFWVLLMLATVILRAQTLPPKPKLIGEGLTVESLKDLKYEDMTRFGVLPPGQSDHARGKGLILLAIATTSFFKGDWVRAHGLLGTSMIECRVLDRIAFRSLFGVSRRGPGRKMSETVELDNGLLFSYQEGNRTPATGESIILRREAVIYRIAWLIKERFTLKQGNYSHYEPQPGRASSLELIPDLRVGVAVHADLLKKGYRDETLEALLGIAYAVLKFDGAKIPNAIRVWTVIGTGQRYVDALQAALAGLRTRSPDINLPWDVLVEIELEMMRRDAKIADQMLLPDHPDQLQALLHVLDEDLDTVQRAALKEKKK